MSFQCSCPCGCGQIPFNTQSPSNQWSLNDQQKSQNGSNWQGQSNQRSSIGQQYPRSSYHLQSPSGSFGQKYSENSYDDDRSQWSSSGQQESPTNSSRVASKFIADDNGRLYPQFRKKISEEPELVDEDSLYESSDRLNKIRARPTVLWKNVPKYYNNTPKDDSAPTFNDEVQEQVDCLANLKLPVIWIYGLPPAKISDIRAEYAKKLARRLQFTYIDMEEQLDRWVQIAGMVQRKLGTANTPCRLSGGKNCGRRPGKNLPTPPPTKCNIRSPDKFLERTIKMSARIKYSEDETLNSSGVVEFCKMAMLHAYPTRGYVLMNFPCCVEEAEIFEEEIWKAASGIYFLETNWSNNKTTEPEIIHPPNFRRDQKYKEIEVERTCDHIGYKSMKVLNAESVTFREKEVIDLFVDHCIDAFPRILMGEKVGIFPKAERSFMDNPYHPTILDAPLIKPKRPDAEVDGTFAAESKAAKADDDTFFEDDKSESGSDES